MRHPDEYACILLDQINVCCLCLLGLLLLIERLVQIRSHPCAQLGRGQLTGQFDAQSGLCQIGFGNGFWEQPIGLLARILLDGQQVILPFLHLADDRFCLLQKALIVLNGQF